MSCETCKYKTSEPENEVFGKDISAARLTRTIKHIIIAYALTVIFLAAAFAVTVIAINDKWSSYLKEYDTISYDYNQDGNGVNIIGNENGVKYNVATVESQSEDPEGR